MTTFSLPFRLRPKRLTLEQPLKETMDERRRSASSPYLRQVLKRVRLEMKFFQRVRIGEHVIGNFGKIRVTVVDVGDVIASFSTSIAFVQQGQTEKATSN